LKKSCSKKLTDKNLWLVAKQQAKDCCSLLVLSPTEKMSALVTRPTQSVEEKYYN